MAATRISYSPELEGALARREGVGRFDATVREAISVLTDRFTEVRLSPAWAAAEEGAEVGADGVTLSLTVLPARFADPLGLTRFLRHELGHVADILDDEFAYGHVPEDLIMTPTLRRRFKLLWACSVDGRTAQLGGSPLHARAEYQAELVRRFPGLSGGVAGMAVNQLWDDQRPRYCCLMRMAADLAAQPAAVLSTTGPTAVTQGARYATSQT
ncbi:MAG TPA: hypothetical protein VGZ23_13965 [bacterium]|nr:hypothetical protein [bacterium]